MSKAQATRALIIERAAALFNQQGYAGASMSDIMQATGLQKGGIYNHFSSKEALALAAFDYAVGLIRQRYQGALKGKRHAGERLKALIETFCTVTAAPPVAGGCPLLNTAIESDDTHPALKARAQQAMDRWRQLIIRVVQLGIQHGEITPTTDAETVATLVIATLEGALMMSQLYCDRIHLNRAQIHLLAYVDTLVIALDCP